MTSLSPLMFAGITPMRARFVVSDEEVRPLSYWQSSVTAPTGMNSRKVRSKAYHPPISSSARHPRDPSPAERDTNPTSMGLELFERSDRLSLQLGPVVMYGISM